MDLFTLFALWLLSGCRRGAAGTEYEPALPGGYPGWPGAPIGLPTSTPEWPQVTPIGLPPFPGAGWEFDEPPPPAVKQRAGQLVNQLWQGGSGAYKIEQTAGRWIAYQAQVVASGKKGVVAYRLKPASSAAVVTASRARPQLRPPARVRPARQPANPAPSPGRAPAPPAPVTPSPKPAASSSPARAVARPSSPVNLPVLRKGWGMLPAPPHNDVRLLQQRLGITADGRFGTQTDKAVREFQRRNGLLQDGVVGEKTWAALFAVRA